jgi:hypothetical protein
MIGKSLIAAAAVATTMAVAAPVQQAQAKVIINLGVGAYGPGYYPGYGYGGYYPVYHPHYGISCNKGRKIVSWSGFHKVQPIDCSAPVYQYKAWKNGAPWRVQVSAGGHIINVKPLYYY